MISECTADIYILIQFICIVLIVFNVVYTSEAAIFHFILHSDN